MKLRSAMSWAARAFAATAVLALLDVVCIVAVFPTAASSGAGLALLLVACFQYIAVFALIVAALGWGWEATGKRFRLPAPPTTLTAVLLAFCAVVVVHFLDQLLLIDENEFPDRVRSLKDIVLGLFIAVVIATALPLRAGLSRVLAKTWIAQPRVFYAIIGYLGAVGGVLIAHFGFAPLYLLGSMATAAAASVAMLLGSVALTWREPGRRAAAAVCAVGGLLLAAMPLGVTRSQHAQFVLFVHSRVAGSGATAVREIFDFDGDGSSPTWMGGADCAEFDAARGPAVREVPGDGIDQDCRGGDAKPPAPMNEKGHLWGDCHVQLGDKPSILLITIEAMRHGVVSNSITPHFSWFASGAIGFPRAYTPASMTSRAIPAIFAGRPFSDLSPPNPLAPEGSFHYAPLAAALSARGYNTIAFITYDLDSRIFLGFKEKNTFAPDATHQLSSRPFVSSSMTTGAHAALERQGDSPLFLWIHYPDSHAPYRIPTGDDGPETPYEKAIRYVDVALGRLLRPLEAAGLLDRFIVVVTADHGEELGQRGQEGHGHQLYEEGIHVPLAMRIPGCPPRVIMDPVSTGQIAATIGELVGIDMPGRSLLAHEQPRTLPIVVEEVPAQTFTFQRAVIVGRHKLIVDVRNGGRLAFDLESDPDEQENVYAANPVLAADLEEAYQRWLDAPGHR